jgi:hypothetical protein
MTIMQRGQEASASFFRDGYVELADKSIIPMGSLTRERFENIGWEVAKQKYQSSKAREDFAAGWLVFGLPTIVVMRDASLSAKESHCDQSETLPPNVIPIRRKL